MNMPFENIGLFGAGKSFKKGDCPNCPRLLALPVFVHIP
jgi:hypothetical protein